MEVVMNDDDGMKNEIQFQGDDPGAVRFGNFINYYQFHSTESRIKNLPCDIWINKCNQKLLLLDIGCNSGDLTQELFKFFTKEVDMKPFRNNCQMLAVDLDPVLIQRAIERNVYDQIKFVSCDVLHDNFNNLISDFLNLHKQSKFDVSLLFSVTMWIHINYGDEVLSKFICNICKITNMIVLEPQNWSSYKTALKRLRKQGQNFTAFCEIKWKKCVVNEIEKVIMNCGFIKIFETVNSWNRKIMIFKSTCTS